MQRLGSILIVFGLLAIVLGFFNRVPRLLMWIYEWGEGAAWAIKIGIIILGVICYSIGRNKNAKG